MDNGILSLVLLAMLFGNKNEFEQSIKNENYERYGSDE